MTTTPKPSQQTDRAISSASRKAAAHVATMFKETSTMTTHHTSGAADRVIEDCPELNMGNYGEVEVERLNDWAIRAHDEINRLHALAAGQAPAQPDPASAPLSRQQIYDMFSFLEGMVNEWGYRQIVNAAEEIQAQALSTQKPAPTPQAAPAPPADSVLEDAARYRWLAGHCRSTSEHWGGRWSIVVDGPAPKSHDSEDDFDAAIDAAMTDAARAAQKEGGKS